MASIIDVLAKKHESTIAAREITDSLHGMFGQNSTQNKHDALKFIFNASMNEGTSVREHVLEIVHFNVAEMDETVIDDASQVSFILDFYKEFPTIS